MVGASPTWMTHPVTYRFPTERCRCVSIVPPQLRCPTEVDNTKLVTDCENRFSVRCPNWEVPAWLRDLMGPTIGVRGSGVATTTPLASCPETTRFRAMECQPAQDLNWRAGGGASIVGVYLPIQTIC